MELQGRMVGWVNFPDLWSQRAFDSVRMLPNAKFCTLVNRATCVNKQGQFFRILFSLLMRASREVVQLPRLSTKIPEDAWKAYIMMCISDISANEIVAPIRVAIAGSSASGNAHVLLHWGDHISDKNVVELPQLDGSYVFLPGKIDSWCKCLWSL